jgi:hypothetical protein
VSMGALGVAHQSVRWKGLCCREECCQLARYAVQALWSARQGARAGAAQSGQAGLARRDWGSPRPAAGGFGFFYPSWRRRGEARATRGPNELWEGTDTRVFCTIYAHVLIGSVSSRRGHDWSWIALLTALGMVVNESWRLNSRRVSSWLSSGVADAAE